jgi:hypothetical protein
LSLQSEVPSGAYPLSFTIELSAALAYMGRPRTDFSQQIFAARIKAVKNPQNLAPSRGRTPYHRQAGGAQLIRPIVSNSIHKRARQHGDKPITSKQIYETLVTSEHMQMQQHGISASNQLCVDKHASDVSVERGRTRGRKGREARRAGSRRYTRTRLISSQPKTAHLEAYQIDVCQFGQVSPAPHA